MNGLNYEICRGMQNFLFSIPSVPATTMSISLLIFIGSMAYLISFLSVHMLPDRRQTRAASDTPESLAGPEQFRIFGTSFLRKVNFASGVGAAVLFAGTFWAWGLDPIASLIISFFGATFLRKVFLDWKYKHRRSPSLQRDRH